jgi:hypothetical protein
MTFTEILPFIFDDKDWSSVCLNLKTSETITTMMEMSKISDKHEKQYFISTCQPDILTD